MDLTMISSSKPQSEQHRAGEEIFKSHLILAVEERKMKNRNIDKSL